MSLAAPLAVLLLTSCDGSDFYTPQFNRIKWSPDGELAMVYLEDAISVVDKDGTVRGEIKPAGVCADWLPDSRGIVAASWIDSETWDELKPLLTEEEQRTAIRLADRCSNYVKQGKTLFTIGVDKQQEVSNPPNQQLADAMVYLKSTDPESYKKFLDNEDVLSSSASEVLRVYSISNLADQKAPIILRTHNKTFDSISVSPGGEAVAYTEAPLGSVHKANLRIMALNQATAKPVAVSDFVAHKFSWCPDGKGLAFIAHKKDTNEGSVGSLNMVTVLDDSGKLLSKPKIKSLAKIGFEDHANVECTADGAVYFSAPENAPGVDGIQKLFKYTKEQTPPVVRMVPDQFLFENSCENFDVSPDGNKIALVDSNGIVDVFDTSSKTLTKAQTMKISPAQAGNSIFCPQWRSNDELCFATLRKGFENGGSVVLWSASTQKETDISAKWTGPLRDFLNPEK